MIAVAFVPVREMCGHRVGVHGVPPGGFPPAGLVGSAFQPTPVCCSSHMTFDPFLVVVQCRDQPGDGGRENRNRRSDVLRGSPVNDLHMREASL